MRRRVVSSVGECFLPPVSGEALKTIGSEGMRIAASFAAKFSIVAQLPWAQVFESGTPQENSMLFCDTPFRKKLLGYIEESSVVSIRLTMEEASAWDGSDRIAALCQIVFKRQGKAYREIKLYFERTSGDCICTSESSPGGGAF